ncbi:uncharacterized protein LOC118827364 isoform X1 [Colossoma macropomum]|uniref:uncharacterized protein LOC118827364 isoform X1 n=1 Tax=Colossoma macropomum TaxID=42526 RepID=UPI0018642616|nr:uncharacterized protein LOC118827364 isoform X1 [Colossoma macropomum]
MKTLHHSKMIFTCVLFFIIYCLVGVNDAIQMDNPASVTGSLRKNVTIPCNFKVTPDQPINSANVIWWKDQAYSGPLLYRCGRNADLSGNCTESTGRYSFGENLTERNIALRISNVTHSDVGVYFCRIELEEKVNWFTSNGIILKVKEPQKLRRIYIQTTVTGEHWVTCEVSGEPLPTVNWTQPENITTSQLFFQTGFLASYSLPVSPNTNYTCQIDGENGPEAQSIYNSHQESTQSTCVCQDDMYLAMLGGLGAVLGIVLIVNLFVLAHCCRREMESI